MSRRWRWAAVALLAVAATGLLGWEALRSEASRAAPPVPASVPLIPQPAGAAPAASGAVPAGSPASSVAHAGATPPASVAAKPNPGTLEICGYGRVSRDEMAAAEADNKLPAWAEAVNARYEAERAALVERLAAGSSRQRVAAALLGEDVEAAARIAAATDDPVAYQIALAACRRDVAFRRAAATQQAWLKTPAASGIAPADLMLPGPVPHQCAALSLERLEAMAPDDALPWLMRLSDARARGDEAAVSQALYQVAQHAQLRYRTRALSGVVAELVGEEPRPGETLALSTAVGRDMFSAADSSWSGVARSCRKEDLRDANRRQLCEQVVKQMAGRVGEILDARVLYSLEERLGLPHGPLSLTREEGDRLLKVMGQQGMDWLADPSCANFSRAGRQLVNLARHSELAYLRAQVKPSPASTPR